MFSTRLFRLYSTKTENLPTRFILDVGAINGKCETLGDGETSVFLCERKTF